MTDICTTPMAAKPDDGDMRDDCPRKGDKMPVSEHDHANDLLCGCGARLCTEGFVPVAEVEQLREANRAIGDRLMERAAECDAARAEVERLREVTPAMIEAAARVIAQAEEAATSKWPKYARTAERAIRAALDAR